MYITSKLLFLLSFQLWLMQKDPTWYVRDSTAQYMQHIYSVLSLSKCPSTKISIKYSKHSQVNKKKYIVKVPFHLHYWRVLCVSAQEGMCWCWDSSRTPPAGTHHIQSHLASTWHLAFVWTFSLRVYFTWSLSHAWVVTHMDCPLSAYRSRNWGIPHPAKRSSWLHLSWLQVQESPDPSCLQELGHKAVPQCLPWVTILFLFFNEIEWAKRNLSRTNPVLFSSSKQALCKPWFCRLSCLLLV